MEMGTEAQQEEQQPVVPIIAPQEAIPQTTLPPVSESVEDEAPLPTPDPLEDELDRLAEMSLSRPVDSLRKARTLRLVAGRLEADGLPVVAEVLRTCADDYES